MAVATRGLRAPAIAPAPARWRGKPVQVAVIVGIMVVAFAALRNEFAWPVSLTWVELPAELEDLLLWLTWVGTAAASVLIVLRFGGWRAALIVAAAFVSFALMGLWEESIQTSTASLRRTSPAPRHGRRTSRTLALEQLAANALRPAPSEVRRLVERHLQGDGDVEVSGGTLDCYPRTGFDYVVRPCAPRAVLSVRARGGGVPWVDMGEDQELLR